MGIMRNSHACSTLFCDYELLEYPLLLLILKSCVQDVDVLAYLLFHLDDPHLVALDALQQLGILVHCHLDVIFLMLCDITNTLSMLIEKLTMLLPLTLA